MRAAPHFASLAEYRARIGDVDFWSAHLARVLARHGLRRATPVAGFNPTYPVFVVGEVVIKLFGFMRAWRAAFEAECAAHARLAQDPEIVAPRVLAEGQLVADLAEPWPYLVTARVPGSPLRDARPSSDGMLALAVQLGEQLRRVHALPARDLAAPECGGIELRRGAAHSSLPSHLVAQVEAFVAEHAGSGRVFLHGDVVAAHVFVSNGALSGLIDWGDATRADPHYELIQLYRDTFACDSDAFRAFLDAYGWPRDAGFAQRTLAEALRRQATGFVTHGRMDVFEPIAARFALDRIETLEQLARELFAI